MKYLILSDHQKNDLRVSKSQVHLPGKTMQIPKLMAKFFWVPGYGLLIYLLTFLYKFDCLYAHDLFLSRAAVMRNKPVYADLHENFYDCFNHSKFKYKFVKWFFRPTRIEKMISKIKKKATIVTVSKSLADIYQCNYFYPNVGDGSVSLHKKTHNDRIFFVGRNRGLEHIDWNEKPKCELIVVSDNFPEINLPDHITLRVLKTGDLRIRSYAHVCIYGLLPNKDCPQSEVASPNKLFTYMKYGMTPICADHMKEVVKVIDKYDCGYHAPTIEQAILKAFADTDTSNKSMRAREAVFDHYNEKKLVEPVFDIIKNNYVSL